MIRIALRPVRPAALLGFALLLAGSGCKNNTKLADLLRTQPTAGTGHSDSGRAGSGRSGPVKLNAQDQETRAKLKPLIQGLNGCIAHYEEWSPIYHSIVGQLEGKDTSRLPHYGVGPTDTFTLTSNDNGADTVACADKLEKGASMPPAIGDLDTAARSAAEDLRKIVGPGQQMDQYTAQKAYLDDHFSKGRMLDASIDPLYTSLGVAGRQLRAAIERQNGTIRQHELDLIDKQQGHSIEWQAHNSLMAARAFYDQVHVLNRENKLTLDALKAAMQPFQSALDDAQAFVAAHPEAAKENAAGEKPLWFSVKDQLLRELVDARELREMLADPNSTNMGFPETPQERREKITNKVDAIRKDFNTLIEVYNSAIHFDD